MNRQIWALMNGRSIATMFILWMLFVVRSGLSSRLIQGVECGQGLPKGCTCSELKSNNMIYSLLTDNGNDTKIMYDSRFFRE